jgi:autotransporter-associated beta strand protein
MSAWMMNLVSLPLAFLFSMNVSTVSWIWDQGADDNSWNSAANWNTDMVPAFADTTAVAFNMNVGRLNENRTFGNRKVQKLIFGANLDSTSKTFALQYRNNANSATHYDLTFEADSGNALIQVTNGIKVDSVTVGATAADKSTILNSTLQVDQNDAGTPLEIIGAVTGNGGLIKSGVGTLNLSGACSFHGDLTVNGGALVTFASCTNTFYIGTNGVNSKINGAGNAQIDGAFYFDLSGSSTERWDEWKIVDVESLSSVTYGASFSVAGFTPTNGVWRKPIDAEKEYEFNPATGLLRVRTYSPAVAMRLGDGDVYNQYKNNPGSYPVCKSGMTHIKYDGRVPMAGGTGNVFDTKKAIIEYGRYPTPDLTSGFDYTGDDVKWALAEENNKGWDIDGVFLYREDWVYTTPRGEHSEDWRILGQDEIDRIKNSIANSNLKCKDTIKLFQLLGGSGAVSGTAAGEFESWSPALKTHLMQFDGLGAEVHIGDYSLPENRKALENLADIAKWTSENGKKCLVFMGGTSRTYLRLPEAQKTYLYLWNAMMDRGVNYLSDDIVYFRQAAYDGKHTPESAINTLTHQQAWVIDVATNNLTAFYISEIRDQYIHTNTTLTVPFSVGEVGVDPSELAVTANSSNTSLVPVSGISFRGTGADRILTVTPNLNQTGATTITLSVDNGTDTRSVSFVLNVNPVPSITATTDGPINSSATWGRAVMPECTNDPYNFWGSFHPLTSVERPYWLDVTAVNMGTTFWKTGAYTIDMTQTNTDKFCGDTLIIETGGMLYPQVHTATLTLNNLALSGGTIFMNNNVGLDLRLTGHRFELNSGTIKSGWANTANIRILDNAYLTGSGIIRIEGMNTSGSEVRIMNDVNTMGFIGKFDIKNYGKLRIRQDIPVEKASFGLIISGTGKYVIATHVALTSLVIDGVSIPPGTYTYNSFTPEQQAMLVSVKSEATLTVVP